MNVILEMIFAEVYLEQSEINEVVPHATVGEDDTLEEVGEVIWQRSPFQPEGLSLSYEKTDCGHLVRISVRTESPMS